MNTEELSNKLQLANSIFVEWEDFSAEIVSLYASPGIGGHLYIILSGSRQSFALGFDAPILLNSRFQWQSDRLEVTFDNNLKAIILRDASNSFVVHARRLQIFKFLHHNAVVERRELMIASRADLMSSRPLQNFYSRSQLNRGIENPNNLQVLVNSYYSFLTSLTMRIISCDPTNNKTYWGDTFMVFSNPSYLSYNRRRDVELKKIRTEERTNYYHLRDEDETLAVDYQDIQISDIGDYAIYTDAAQDKIDWFPSMSFQMKAVPQLLVDINLWLNYSLLAG